MLLISSFTPLKIYRPDHCYSLIRRTLKMDQSYTQIIIVLKIMNIWQNT